MINHFLVQFLKNSEDPNVRLPMLEAMSKILAFSIEEKEQLGMVKKTKVAEVGKDQRQARGISDKLINFFLDDEDDDDES